MDLPLLNIFLAAWTEHVCVFCCHGVGVYYIYPNFGTLSLTLSPIIMEVENYPK